MTAILVTKRVGEGVQNRKQDKPMEPAAPGNQNGTTGEQEELG